jgi:hypothetical protein
MGPTPTAEDPKHTSASYVIRTSGAIQPEVRNGAFVRALVVTLRARARDPPERIESRLSRFQTVTSRPQSRMRTGIACASLLCQ